MKTQLNANHLSPRRRTLRRLTAMLGIVAGIAVVGTAVASVRFRVESKPEVASYKAKHPLPQEWVWKKKAVNFDDMVRK